MPEPLCRVSKLLLLQMQKPAPGIEMDTGSRLMPCRRMNVKPARVPKK